MADTVSMGVLWVLNGNFLPVMCSLWWLTGHGLDLAAPWVGGNRLQGETPVSLQTSPASTSRHAKIGFFCLIRTGGHRGM